MNKFWLFGGHINILWQKLDNYPRQCWPHQWGDKIAQDISYGGEKYTRQLCPRDTLSWAILTRGTVLPGGHFCLLHRIQPKILISNNLDKDPDPDPKHCYLKLNKSHLSLFKIFFLKTIYLRLRACWYRIK